MFQLNIEQLKVYGTALSNALFGIFIDKIVYNDAQEAIIVSATLSEIKERMEQTLAARVRFESTALSPTSMIIDFFIKNEKQLMARYRIERKQL